jgi:hypothetical protein
LVRVQYCPPPRRSKVRYTQKPQSTDRGFLVISVHDHGQGCEGNEHNENLKATGLSAYSYHIRLEKGTKNTKPCNRLIARLFGGQTVRKVIDKAAGKKARFTT